MKIFLHKFKGYLFLLLMLAFSLNANAQCNITGTVSVKFDNLTYNSFSACSSVSHIITIGDGVAPSSLKMDQNLDLTNLGPIQLIVNSNSNIDFTTSNYDLTLAAGSSITFLGTGTLVPYAGNDCSNSDRIKIGNLIVSSCLGSGDPLSFPQLVDQGGYSPIAATANPSSICNSGSSIITVLASGANSYRWYNVASGGTSLQSSSSTTYNTGIISSTTTYYVEAVYTTYTTVRKAVTLTVNPLPTITGALSVCKDLTTSLTGSGTPNSTNPWISETPSVATVNSSGAVTGVSAGTSVITYKNSNGCTQSATVTVNALPIAPSVSTTQPTCAVPTASITITQVAGETYSFDGNAYSGTLLYSGLVQGSSHTIYAKNAAGCVSGVTNVVINSLANKWTTSWSNGTPTVDQNLEFAGNYVINADVTACSCQVTSGGWVDVNSGFTLKLTNAIDVSGTGRILFKDKSSLVQINNVTNTGNIKYERKISPTIRETDYTYWSSPVAGFTLGGVYPNNTVGLFYSYGVTSGVEDWQPESATTIMAAGIGYIINGAQPMSGPFPPPSTNPFFGVPNNGDIQVPVIFTNPSNLPSTDANYGVSYLLGNPYPSAINADTFLTLNSGVIESTLYFWTHNTDLQPANPTDTTLGTGAFAYTSNDYASYNFTGGVGVGTGNTIPGTPPTEQTANRPTGKIAAGQGFFATCNASGNVTFNNNMRVAGNNAQFFKSRNPKVKTAIEKNRIWLNLTNTQGAFKQTLVGYITDATNDYDSRFDGESFDGNEFVDFYSVNQDKNLVIQGRALPFDENDEVPLGYRTTIKGDFTINIDQVDGSLTNQAVFIEDKLTNTVTDLKSSNYTFNTVAGTFNDRFVLRYKDNSTAKTLATANFDSQANKVLVSNKNKQIKINSFAETIDKVTIYDMLGKQIYQKDKVNSNELSIANLVSSRQTLIVKTVLQNGSTVTDKIIY